MELWVATSNSGKMNEFKTLLSQSALDIHSSGELSVYSSPPETGDTFEANARIKAKSLKSLKPEAWVIADDSGLEVEGLNNFPGVHSARYAGEKASDAENTAKLLKMMSLRSATHRTAQFRCVLVAIDPQGKEYVFEGSIKGEIARSPKGSQGFGYDNVFIPEKADKTFAELGPGEKNKVSHRARAIKMFREQLLNS